MISIDKKIDYINIYFLYDQKTYTREDLHH